MGRGKIKPTRKSKGDNSNTVTMIRAGSYPKVNPTPTWVRAIPFEVSVQSGLAFKVLVGSLFSANFRTDSFTSCTVMFVRAWTQVTPPVNEYSFVRLKPLFKSGDSTEEFEGRASNINTRASVGYRIPENMRQNVVAADNICEVRSNCRQVALVISCCFN